MKNIIREILKEELDSDWDWLREIPMSVDSGYFTEKEENGTSLSMAEKVMDDHNVTLEGAIDLMWENFPYDAENVFNWFVINPKMFNYEGVDYSTDVDKMGGFISIYPMGRSGDLQFFVTPNYNEYGVTPIDYIVNDEYTNHSSEIRHPNFNNSLEMKDYYRNQHINDVMGTILDYMDEHYNYSNII